MGEAQEQTRFCSALRQTYTCLFAGKLSKPTKLRPVNHMDQHVLPGTTRVQHQPVCTGSPAVPTAAGSAAFAQSQELLLWRGHPIPSCWSLETFFQGKWPPLRKKLLFLSRLTLSGLSPDTERCLLPGPSIPGQSSVYHRASLYTQASADGGHGTSRALSG